ncbi:hypothetical protein ANO14919_132620 [Xylariales sp. No.14919]|nr:hypothetical protein ANO14919_132620 [Xylariales sp. No.14919]
MSPVYSTPYGRGSRIVLSPSKRTPKLLLEDYRFQTSSKNNMMAWMDRQSAEIAAAFQQPWSLSSRTNRAEVANRIGVEKDQKMQNHESEDVFRYRRRVNRDSILEFTTLMDMGSDDLPIDSQQPRWADEVANSFGSEDGNEENEYDADECIESNVRASRTETRPSALSLEKPRFCPEFVESPMSEEQPEEQAWQINSHGHLVVSEALSTELMSLRAAPFHPDVEKSLLPGQHAQLATLAAANRQLEAFKQALRFAYYSAFSHTGGVNFTTEVGLYDCAPSAPYPVIYITMDAPREDAELQHYLAYNLLRGMLKRYGDLPFPDRIDIRESGTPRGRLLVPYGAGAETEAEMGGAGERVRCRIVEEMRLEKGTGRC